MEETRQQAPAGKDLTAIGLEILQSARNELYLNLPYLDVALCSLAFAPGGGMTVSLATDGETLYYDGSFLAERYLRTPTAVNRAYLHVILHCMLRHIYKKHGKMPELWDLACDAAVESILDELDGGTVLYETYCQIPEFQALEARISLLRGKFFLFRFPMLQQVPFD